MTDGTMRGVSASDSGEAGTHTGNEYLTQDEVDALLTGVSGTADDAAPDADGIRPYRIGKQERVVRTPMPTLDLINDRCARALRASFADFLRRSPEIAVGPARTTGYEKFMRTLSVPASLNLVQAKALRGNALVVFEPALVSLAVDTLFGGNGRLLARTEGREFTPTELRIIQRMLQLILDEYGNAWAKVHPLHFEFVRAETYPQFASIATPLEPVIVSTFTVGIGAAGGAFHLCIPYSMLAPLQGIVRSTRPGDQAEPDQSWARRLTQQLQAAALELTATLATTSVTVNELLATKVGDVLPVDIPATVRADVNGVPLLECSYGVSNGRYALRVERMLASPDDVIAGGTHV